MAISYPPQSRLSPLVMDGWRRPMKRLIFSRNGDEGDSRAALTSTGSIGLPVGPFRLTAIVMSVSSPNVGAMGTGFRTPPSTRSPPLYLNGVKKRGIAKEARMASKRLPDRIQTSFWPLRSVATAVYEIGRPSISFSPTKPIRVLTSFSPLTSPRFSHERSSSVTMSTFVKARTHCSYSSSFPAAYMPPMTAPIEQPTIDLILKSLSSSQRMTPMCAKPRAPPLPRTRDTVFLFVVDIFSPHAFPRRLHGDQCMPPPSLN